MRARARVRTCTYVCVCARACAQTLQYTMESSLDIAGEVKVTIKSRRRKSGQQTNKESTDTTKRRKTVTNGKTKRTPKPNLRGRKPQRGPQSEKPAA